MYSTTEGLSTLGNLTVPNLCIQRERLSTVGFVDLSVGSLGASSGASKKSSAMKINVCQCNHTQILTALKTPFYLYLSVIQLYFGKAVYVGVSYLSQ